jgi:two-component system OmpR family response regulator
MPVALPAPYLSPTPPERFEGTPGIFSARAAGAPPVTIVIVGDGRQPCRSRADALRDLAFRVVTVPNSAAAAMRPLNGADLFLVEGSEQFAANHHFYLRRRATHGARTIVVDGGDDREACIQALELGADDAITSACTVRELWARIKAVLNLHRPRPREAARKTAVYTIGSLGDFIPATMVLNVAGGPRMALNRTENALLLCLANAPGARASRDDVLDAFPDDLVGNFDRSIDQAVSRLRRRLAPHGHDLVIETCPREGYKLNADVRRAYG